MQSAVCLLSVVPVRSESSHRSEMVSQLLFGEFVTVGEERDDFVAVKCLYDGYEGWVQANQLTPVSEEQVRATDEYIGVFSTNVLVDGNYRMIPFASLAYFNPDPVEPLLFGNRQVLFSRPDAAVWKVGEQPFSAEALKEVIAIFLDTPYLWGGRSVWGTDCSGFVQQVCKFFGVKLLRDAYLQAGQGGYVNSLAEAATGDLAFFQNQNGKVTHVGILLPGNMIAHASGKVRVDTIDAEGIINKETGKRTHQFHSIRRFF